MKANHLKEKTKKFIKDIIDILKQPAMRILPGQLAFYFLMSFVPIVAIVILIFSKTVSNYNLLAILSEHIPPFAVDLITSAVSSANSYGNIIFLFVFYIVLASNGPLSITRIANILYNIKDPKYIQSRLKALIMTIVMVILILFLIFIPFFGDAIIKFIINYFSNFASFTKYIPIYQISKIIISLGIVYILLKVIYILAPDKKIKSKTTTKGALFTTITWIISTEIFSYYITNIANYNVLYGNFSNILVILFWLYLLSYLFVMGLVINSNNYYKEEDFY